ncbi:MAG: hypothetical protein ABSH56_02760 [Bryobacteraceae bacterium]|jgi:hypothetical protein
MKLADLRKLSIRRGLRIRFTLNGGMECLIGEDGIARVPGLHSIPKFNLEEELAAAQEFILEPPPVQLRKPTPARSLNRQELETMATGTGASSGPAEHDDE